jgi:hypothetical protein
MLTRPLTRGRGAVLGYFRNYRFAVLPCLRLYCPWCSPTTFFHIPLAHAFLNGLVNGFWQMVSRDKAIDEKLTRGRYLILHCESARRIARNFSMMHSTSGFASNFKNILQCGPTLVPKSAKEAFHRRLDIFRTSAIVCMVEMAMCRPNNKQRCNSKAIISNRNAKVTKRDAQSHVRQHPRWGLDGQSRWMLRSLVLLTARHRLQAQERLAYCATYSTLFEAVGKQGGPAAVRRAHHFLNIAFAPTLSVSAWVCKVPFYCAQFLQSTLLYLCCLTFVWFQQRAAK